MRRNEAGDIPIAVALGNQARARLISLRCISAEAIFGA